MASDLASPLPASVQCPICSNDYTPETINHHLDACLLENTACNGRPRTETSEPSLKKLRVSFETKPSTPPDNGASPGTSRAARSQPSGMFSLFQPDKSRVSLQNGCNDLWTGKQSVLNKRIKPSDSEPESQVSDSDSDRHAAKSKFSPWSLLTKGKPLADILRPNTLEEYFGQNKVIGQQTLFRSLLEAQEIPSFILWGPPGCGKVSCCFLYINTCYIALDICDATFETLVIVKRVHRLSSCESET